MWKKVVLMETWILSQITTDLLMAERTSWQNHVSNWLGLILKIQLLVTSKTTIWTRSTKTSKRWKDKSFKTAVVHSRLSQQWANLQVGASICRMPLKHLHPIQWWHKCNRWCKCNKCSSKWCNRRLQDKQWTRNSRWCSRCNSRWWCKWWCRKCKEVVWLHHKHPVWCLLCQPWIPCPKLWYLICQEQRACSRSPIQLISPREMSKINLNRSKTLVFSNPPKCQVLLKTRSKVLLNPKFQEYRQVWSQSCSTLPTLMLQEWILTMVLTAIDQEATQVAINCNRASNLLMLQVLVLAWLTRKRSACPRIFKAKRRKRRRSRQRSIPMPTWMTSKTRDHRCAYQL